MKNWTLTIEELYDLYEDLKRPSLLFPDKNEFREALYEFNSFQLIEIQKTLESMEEYEYCNIVKKVIQEKENNEK